MSAPATEHSGPHLSIGEVLAQLQEEFPDITISKIRFLESQGLIDPERTPSGYRKFYGPDLDRLRWILYQQREHFLPLKVIKERLDDFGPTGAPSESGNGSGPPRTGSAPPRRRTPQRDPTVLTPPLPFEELEAIADEAEVLGDVRRAKKAGGDGDDTKTGLTRTELAEAAGLTPDQLQELDEFGVLVPMIGRGERALYDDDALHVAEIAAGFYARGIEPRHLRMYQHFSEREAVLFQQVLVGYLRQRNPAAQARFQAELEELTRLGQRLRVAMLRQALRESLHE